MFRCENNAYRREVICRVLFQVDIFPSREPMNARHRRTLFMCVSHPGKSGRGPIALELTRNISHASYLNYFYLKYERNICG